MPTTTPKRLELGQLILEPGPAGILFTLSHTQSPETRHIVKAPTFEVNGQARGDFAYQGQAEERALPRGGRELTLLYLASGSPNLELRVSLRAYPHSPVLRFRYRLSATTPAQLTKQSGQDQFRYFTLHGNLNKHRLTEIQLSHFDPVIHSYLPNTEHHAPDELYDDLTFVGPIALLHTAHQTLLAAYEHGADHPQSFLQFQINRSEGELCLTLTAKTGNYYAGQPLSPQASWASVWFELALTPIPLPDFLKAYRTFFLDEICESTESRRPDIYYNTWNFQERNHYFNGRPYLESMNFEGMSAEIEVAHRIGIDVFVIDTGWYEKTGDWLVNTARFPDGLQKIRQKLQGYGMKLGLWFNPTVAALTSEVYRAHPEYMMTFGDEPSWRGPVWETEESVAMCLASDYADDYLERMVRLYHTLGVTYFKWDGVNQFGCDSPHHHHGTTTNSPEERAAGYAYQMGLEMIRIAETISQRCPGAFVDFDITENGRFVGLGFLAASKYYLVNNGPYFSNLDIPNTTKIDPDTINALFYPGPARPRVCRQGIKYDGVIPSILFMTHYLTDAPELSQRNSLASLMLGGNGLWGDLLNLSEADTVLLAGHLSRYKRVAVGATRAYPRIRGFAGSSPEIYEKIDPATATGLIAFFTVNPGTITHVTQPINLERLETLQGEDTWERLPDNRLKITVQLERDDARVVYVMGR
jgi:alpha-galactosidase